MDKKQILALDSKKHVKIWLLHKLGMSRREIAEALGTNPGHVGNEIKAYEKNEDKRKAAESIFSGGGDKPSKEELKKIIDAAEDQMTKAVKAGDTKAVKKGNEFIGKLIDQYNEAPELKTKTKNAHDKSVIDKLKSDIEAKEKEAEQLQAHYAKFPSQERTGMAAAKARAELASLKSQLLELEHPIQKYNLSDLKDWEDASNFSRSDRIKRRLELNTPKELDAIKERIKKLAEEAKRKNPMPYGLTDRERSYYYEGYDHLKWEATSLIDKIKESFKKEKPKAEDPLIPELLERKSERYTKEGWSWGRKILNALNLVDVKKLSNCLSRTLDYAIKTKSFIDISTKQGKPLIEFNEIVDYNSNKFENKPRNVPHFEPIGKNKSDDVFFTYGTSADSAHKPFTVDELEEFIKLNLKTDKAKKLGKGGVLQGPKHGSGGIKAKSPNGPLEVEGGEIIINAAAAKEHCEELSEINQSAGGGVAFPCDHPALDGIQGPMGGKGAKLTYGGKIGAMNTDGVKWFKDKAGRDRFEIDDSDAIVNINDIIRFSASSVKQNKTISLLLSDIITVWSGYINYPDLKNVNLVFIPNGDPDGALYTYWPDLDLIFVNSKYITNEITDKNSEREKGVRPGSVHGNDTGGAKGVSNNLSGKFAREIRKRLFHEIQHPIQKREGIEITPSDDDAIIYALKQKHGKLQMGDSEFINWIEEYTGDKYKYIKSDFYKTIPSEYEALDVERRAFYTKEQRESIRPEIELKKAGYGTSIGAVAGMMGDGAKIAEGIDVEKEHDDLYNEISQRLEADGHKMPMSKDEFFRMIAAAHIKEREDYYPLLKKYVEHAPYLMDKPYYLLTKEEVIACRDFIEMREAAGIELTVRCHQRLKDLARYSMVKFNTLLKNLK